MRTAFYGTLFGVISGLVNVVRVIQSFFYLHFTYVAEYNIQHNKVHLSQGEPTFSENSDYRSSSEYFDLLRTRQYFVLVYGLVMIICCFYLMYGAKKNRHWMVLPWLVLTVAGIIVIVSMIFFDRFTLTGNQIYSNVLYIVVQSLIFPSVFFLWLELRREYTHIAEKNQLAQHLSLEFQYIKIHQLTKACYQDQLIHQ